MGREMPQTSFRKAKKPKTLIQQKREERKLKKRLPKPPRPPPTPAKPRDLSVPKIVRPKPKPQNPGFQKWMSLFKREITLIETHLKHCEQYRQHWRDKIDQIEDPEEKVKWESGEVGNWVRLLDMMERTREILVQAREVNAWIVPPKHLGLKKNLPGMKEFVLGLEKEKAEAAANGHVSSDGDSDSVDEDVEDGDKATDDYIPLIAKKKRKVTGDVEDKGEGKSEENGKEKVATEPAAPNSFFMVDTEPTPVDINALSKESRKRTKSEASEERKAAKKAKTEKTASIVKPQQEPEPESESTSAPAPKPKTSKVDFSAIEAQLADEIDTATRAKQEREKTKAEKLAKKEKKRKRLSEGESEKEVKKAKKDTKDKKEKKRKAPSSGDEDIPSDDNGQKKHKAAV